MTNVDMELSLPDFVEEEFDPPITVDDRVMLCAGDRQQKRQPAYEFGWDVTGIVFHRPCLLSIIYKVDIHHQSKTVNINLLKPSPEAEDEVEHTADGALLANAAELEFDSSTGSDESSSDSEADILALKWLVAML